jgi:hypothetical protein
MDYFNGILIKLLLSCEKKAMALSYKNQPDAKHVNVSLCLKFKTYFQYVSTFYELSSGRTDINMIYIRHDIIKQKFKNYTGNLQ